MSYFTDKEWWDTRYKIRRSITLTPDELQPGAESLCAVKLIKSNLLGKVKPDYSDLSLTYQSSNGSAFVEIPFYVLDETDEVSIVFSPVEEILTEQDRVYHLYYGGKSVTRLDDASDILDSNTIDLEDFGQESPEGKSTRWTFQKPTIIWTGNTSNSADGRALFEFYGHKVDISFKAGPFYGMLDYQINDGEKTTVDCYAFDENSLKIVSIDTGKVQNNKVRITTLDQKNPSSSSTTIKLVKCDYHQILMGNTNEEEFYSTLGKSYTVGS